LPLTTKILLGSADFITKNWIMVIGGIVGTIVLFRAWVATPAGGEMKDRFLLHAPMIGPVVQKATVSRYARVLGTLVYGGVPILEALEIAGLSAGKWSKMCAKGAPLQRR
jgi:type II secretory pathway component PulF